MPIFAFFYTTMYRVVCLVFGLMVCSVCAIAQSLSGIVVSANGNIPIAGASVFFSNTSLGTVTDADGRFYFGNLPKAKYDLVVSCLGFETQSQTLDLQQTLPALTIVLVPKAAELAGVTVEPYEKDNWERWGKFFIENFIGQSEYASRCVLKNPKVLQFRRYKKSNRLVVYANAPIIIENRYLGYRISYQLEQFEYSFKNKTLLFQGYTLFNDLKEEPKPKIERRRNEMYLGSLMHFMRVFFRNQLATAGFELRTIKAFPNLEKQRVKAIYSKQLLRGNGVSFDEISAGVSNDSMVYYNRILQQPDFNEVLYNTPIPADSVGFAAATDLAGLTFTDYLEVTYIRKSEPLSYANQQGRPPDTKLRSRLQLINGATHVVVQRNGCYAHPTDIMLHGYWAFWEKLATMLPIDFEPARDE